jgi:quercetin dioxygenase-like cupin family protein
MDAKSVRLGKNRGQDRYSRISRQVRAFRQHDEQVVHQLYGELELTIDGVTTILHPGNVAVIPSNAVHSGRALTACHVMDVFYPLREDYMKEGKPFMLQEALSRSA